MVAVTGQPVSGSFVGYGGTLHGASFGPGLALAMCDQGYVLDLVWVQVSHGGV